MKSILTEKTVKEKLGEKRTDSNGVMTEWKLFENGYVGYSETKGKHSILDMYIHDMPNGDTFKRSIEHTTESLEKNDFFEATLSNTNGNYNVITRVNDSEIQDIEYNENHRIVRERFYKLHSDNFYDGDQCECYDGDKEFLYGCKNEKEYLNAKDYLRENASLIQKYYRHFLK